RVRLAATEAAISPHLLHMTATPIPRTLAIHRYGDLETSVIRELPAGRAPIATELIRPERRSEAFDLIRAEVDAGRQAFIVYPLVDESEAVAARAVEEEAARLARGELAGITLERLHG